MQSKCIEIIGVSHHFFSDTTTITVLNQIHVSFAPGRTYAIMGDSGAGKSTLMRIVLGFEQPSSGSVRYNGESIHAYTPAMQAHYIQDIIGCMFQVPHLIKELSVIENVMLPGLMRGDIYKNGLSHARMLLHSVGLTDKLHEWPSTLSGGQQQRAALARALYNSPLFLWIDEPTANLDQRTGRMVVQYLMAYAKKHQIGLIINTHDTWVAEQMQTIYILEQGSLYEKK